MVKRSKKNKALVVLSILFVVQAVWFGVVEYFVNKSQTKTTATVIRIENVGNTCNFIGRSLCDSSDLLYPVYEYYDLNGKRYVKDDRYLGEFKKNNPLRLIFGKQVGDKVTAYYTSDKPEEISFMGGIFSYVAWFIPLYITVIVLIGWCILYLLSRLKSAKIST